MTLDILEILLYWSGSLSYRDEVVIERIEVIEKTSPMATKSEIVKPVRDKNGEIVEVLDIDSDMLNDFPDVDRADG